MDRDPLLTSLGNTVRELRAGRKWSRAELSNRSGVSERFLADVEGGQGNPSILSLIDIVRALGVSLADLFARAEAASANRDVRHVALLGLRGAGKSTVGPLVASRLRRPFVELDARVEAAAGLALAEMFQVHGEDYYRKTERAALERLLGEREACVVAIGGGLVVESESLALLKSRTATVWLRAEPKDHWERVLAQGDTRPMAHNAGAFGDLVRLFAVREPFYRQADITVVTTGRTIAAIVDEIVERLTKQGPRRGQASIAP